MAANPKLDLGRFVRSRKRRDGTDHVFMSVPTSLRPEGWPKTINLPCSGKRAGRLDDPRFFERVRNDAKRLNERLDQRRQHEETYRSDRRNVRALAEIYFRTQRYRALSKGRKNRNRRDALIFADWAADRGDPDFASLKKYDFEDFLSLYDEKPALKLDLRSTLNILCVEAIEAGWRADNPIARLPWTVPPLKEEVILWRDDVAEAYAQMAHQMKQPGLGALILFGLRSGQRLGDLREARHDVHYRRGMFQVKQAKTGVMVKFPVPAGLCDLIESVRVEGSPFLFTDADTGTGFTHFHLWARFAEVRRALTREGGPKMQLRTLRHSAVCQMVDARIPLPQIAAVTGHLLARVHAIIARYAVDREGFAVAAMKQLHRSKGGHDEDFVTHDPFEGRDAQTSRKAQYSLPPVDPDRPGRWLGAAHGQHRLDYILPPLSDLWPEENDDEISNFDVLEDA